MLTLVGCFLGMPTSRPLVPRWQPLVLQTDAMFRIQHTDPWVRGDAHRTSRTITVQVGRGRPTVRAGLFLLVQIVCLVFAH